MLIAILIPATVLVAIWLLLQIQVTHEDWLNAAYNTILDNLTKIEELQKKDARREEALSQYEGVIRKLMEILEGSSSEKKIEYLRDQNEAIKRGDMRAVSIFDLPGYVVLRKHNGIRSSSLYRSILDLCKELYGKKYADKRAMQMLSKMISYSLLGIAVSLTLSAFMLGIGKTTAGLAVLIIGTTIVVVLVYAHYDEVQDRLKKRRAAISRQFPNVVSKLALLVTSGMIMSRAWRETAESQNLELYREMRLTADELSHLVDPSVAFTNFINRCNTKETTKLASAIIQSQSKGNAEIGVLLKGMAHDAWQERRHTAKRDSEAANSKLMIPTMLLFGSILAMIMVPIVLNFQGF